MKKTNAMKKFLTAALSLAMALSLAACTGAAGGSSSVQQPSTSGNGSGSVQQTEYKVGLVKYMDHASLDQIEENVMKSRILLVEAARVTLRNVLRLLGVSAPEKM